MNIFITSIGENSGKTIFSAGIAAVMQSLSYEMGIYKPIQTGCKYANDKQFSPDLNFIKKIDPNIKTYSAYNFKTKSTPAIAADKERLKFTMEKIIRGFNNATKENDIVIVEGCGGLMTPVTGKITIADIAVTLKLPTIIVADAEGDFINKTLMTISAAEVFSLEILGIVFNKYSPHNPKDPHHEEVKLLEQMIDYDILGYLPNVDIKGAGINPETLISETLQNINLSKVFNMEIPKLSF